MLVFAVAFAATAMLVPPVRNLAIRFGIVDEPGPRRVNKKPIPRLGGVAMFGGFLIALLVEYILELVGFWHGPIYIDGQTNTRIIGIIVGLAFIVGVGVIDDMYSIRPIVKFLGQIIASCIIAGTGTLLYMFHLPFSTTAIELGFWAYPITVIYLVCFINIINLIDGLDGLAAGITAFASLTLFIMLMTLSRFDAALLAAITVAIAAGFLIYNFNPASIFMGDSGSMLLGLLLGTISLVGTARFLSATMLIVPIIVALVPIIDTAAAIVRRVRGHESIATPDTGHIHHRLLRKGYSQRKAVLLIYLWTLILCIGALLMWEFGWVAKIVIFILLVISSAIIIHRLGLFGPVRQRHGRRDVIYDTEGIDPEDEDRPRDGRFRK